MRFAYTTKVRVCVCISAFSAAKTFIFTANFIHTYVNIHWRWWNSTIQLKWVAFCTTTPTNQSTLTYRPFIYVYGVFFFCVFALRCCCTMKMMMRWQWQWARLTLLSTAAAAAFILSVCTLWLAYGFWLSRKICYYNVIKAVFISKCKWFHTHKTSYITRWHRVWVLYFQHLALWLLCVVIMLASQFCFFHSLLFTTHSFALMYFGCFFFALLCHEHRKKKRKKTHFPFHKPLKTLHSFQSTKNIHGYFDTKSNIKRIASRVFTRLKWIGIKCTSQRNQRSKQQDTKKKFRTCTILITYNL